VGARRRVGALSSFWEELVACSGDLSSLLELITRRVAEIVGEASVLTIVSPDGQMLEPAATYHPDREIDEFIREVLASGSCVIGGGIAGRVAADRSPALLNGIPPEELTPLLQPSTRAFAERHPIRALLIVPMVAAGELVGTLGAVRIASEAPFEKEDLLAVEALAERAALAIADARRPPPVLGPEDYKAIYRHSLDGILFTAPDGRILAANPAACAILALSEAEICRRGRVGLLLSDDPRTNEAVQERERTGSVRTEIPMRRGSGEVFTADVASSSFTGARGEVRASVIFRDVSEQVALREQQERWACRGSTDRLVVVIMPPVGGRGGG
jgi:PAS domain S-box-containing protein